MILEIAIDGLKLAALNTPNMLTTSLSIDVYTRQRIGCVGIAVRNQFRKTVFICRNRGILPCQLFEILVVVFVEQLHDVVDIKLVSLIVRMYPIAGIPLVFIRLAVYVLVIPDNRSGVDKVSDIAV